VTVIGSRGHDAGNTHSGPIVSGDI
jgi:hypothetical protein